MRLSLLSLLLLLLVLPGCLPRTTVHRHPGPRDLGVRYYRPKPYLLIKPMTARDGLPVDGYVSMEQVTMPDFSEEYSIHVRSGLGTIDTEIKLEDGWKLTGLNISVDSQFDESLKAMADVIEAVPRATAAAASAYPIFPDDLLLRNLAGSIGSRVGPAVTSRFMSYALRSKPGSSTAPCPN